MVNLHHISKTYTSDSVDTKALDDISLTVKQGEFVSIMGPSGCGKTTLINIIGMLDNYNQGLYVFDNLNVGELNEKAKAKLRKSHISFVFQNFNLLDELTVFENIELPLVYLGVAPRERKEKIERMLDRISLGHRSKHYPQQLSGGQQQRVAVGRALITEPKLILADEPTGNLDTAQGNKIMEMLTHLNDNGTTIIMVTHNIDDAAYTNRIIKLLDGQIISQKNLLRAKA